MPHDHAAPTVLIADDAPDMRAMLRSLLAPEAVTVLAEDAGDGDACLALATAHHPDLVLLDLAMPGRSGTDVLPELRRTVPEARIVVLSGFASPEVRRQALAAGADRYVLKGPRGMEEILDEVRALRR